MCAGTSKSFRSSEKRFEHNACIPDCDSDEGRGQLREVLVSGGRATSSSRTTSRIREIHKEISSPNGKGRAHRCQVAAVHFWLPYLTRE